MQLEGKNVLITGAALRIGRAMALAVAREGANLIVHYRSSHDEAKKTLKDIESIGVNCSLIQADFRNPTEVEGLIRQAEEQGPLFGLVNNAAIFQDNDIENTDLEIWQNHMDVNLTAPFLLSQAFFHSVAQRKDEGRIINILDWQALRPAADHLPYTISKAALTALTRSLAVSLAPAITVNGIALGAILPPSDAGDTSKILDNVPAKRWAELDEVGETLLFLLKGPGYITGEIIHLDGGRHLL